MSHILNFILIVSLAFFTACHPNPSSDFHLLSSEMTGITFNNQIEESDSLNPLNHFYLYNGAGVGVGDINNDGLPDIFFAGNMVSSKLYLNKGDLSFEDITEAAKVRTNLWCTGVSMADVNADGWLDIYVSVADKSNRQKSKNLLFINQRDLTFKEMASEYGLDDDGYGTQAVFFDYDLDGDLDAYLLTNGIENRNHNELRRRKIYGEGITTDRLYRNEGNSTFVNVSTQAGITVEGYGLGVGIIDVNHDGWPDIYCANDFITNDLLWVNNQDGTFSEKAHLYFNQVSHNGMGIDVADFNNDGLMDIMETDMLPESNEHHKNMTPAMNYNSQLLRYEYGYMTQFVRNTLQTQTKQGQFSEVGRLAGVHKTDWSWAPLFLDMNNDGLKDLFISNGYGRDITNLDYIVYANNNPFGSPESRKKRAYENMKKLPEIKIPNYFYINKGELQFEDMGNEWGVSVPSLSNGASYSDLDLDGDLDIVVNNINDKAFIYENRSSERNHYIKLKLTGSAKNTGGIGTLVTVYDDGKIQTSEQYPVRGYASSVDPVLHFGLGKSTNVDSIIIKWPDSKFVSLKDLAVDTLLDVKYTNSTLRPENRDQNAETLLFEVNSPLTEIKHSENFLVDFENQPLLLKMLSREGPALVFGDINGDGYEDMVMGSSYGDTTFVWVQDERGSYTSSQVLPYSWNFEDQGMLLFDFDLDGDLDLYAASGGNQFISVSKPSFYQDRLYLNDGEGSFSISSNIVPELQSNSSTVNGCDYDKDGDIDLFIGGRVRPHSYPLSDRSVLLENEQNSFQDATSSLLDSIGLVTSALWSDFDNDGWVDLIVVGEWMPVTFFKNEKGQLRNVTSTTKVGQYHGFWNSITGADFDKDGDIDYVVGNLGLNNDLKASPDEPMRIIAKDFDNNGTVDPIIGHYLAGKKYPLPTRDALISQINAMRRRFPRYQDYASAYFDELFTDQEKEGAYEALVNHLSTSYFENNGDGTFLVKSLPIAVQRAPVYGIHVDDYNGDGFKDILIGGNRSDSELISGFLIGSNGSLLLGDGNGGFETVSDLRGGLNLSDDVRSVAMTTTSEEEIRYVVGLNDRPLQAYGQKSKSRYVKWMPGDVYAVVNDGEQSEKVEFYLGSGYWSQSSSILPVAKTTRSITFYNEKGVSRTVSFDNL